MCIYIYIYIYIYICICIYICIYMYIYVCVCVCVCVFVFLYNYCSLCIMVLRGVNQLTILKVEIQVLYQTFLVQVLNLEHWQALSARWHKFRLKFHFCV